MSKDTAGMVRMVRVYRVYDDQMIDKLEIETADGRTFSVSAPPEGDPHGAGERHRAMYELLRVWEEAGSPPLVKPESFEKYGCATRYCDLPRRRPAPDE